MDAAMMPILQNQICDRHADSQPRQADLFSARQIQSHIVMLAIPALGVRELNVFDLILTEGLLAEQVLQVKGIPLQ